MQYTKYTDALALMDNTIRMADKLSEEGHRFTYWGHQEDWEAVKPMHEAWDKLYEFVFANFKDPRSLKKVKGEKVELSEEVENELESMREMFSYNREELEERLYKIPPVILEQCFPVWMARYMLTDRQVHIHPVHLETFEKFHEAYSFMIINARRMENDYV